METDFSSRLDDAIDVYKRVFAAAAACEHINTDEMERQRLGLQAMIEAHWARLHRLRLDVISGRLAARDYDPAANKIIGLIQSAILHDAKLIIRDIDVSGAMRAGEYGN